MAENSKIEWCDHTFNPWIGCTKVSEGCAHCYAERDFDKRRKIVNWGKGQPRKRTSVGNWKKPLAWNKQAEQEGVRYRVFCASLADVFDPEVPDEWRHDLFTLVHNCPNLVWLLLTKRPDYAADYLGRYANFSRTNHIWIGTSVEDQATADERIPQLLQIPKTKRFLSCEPLLGAVSLPRVDFHCDLCGGTGILGRWPRGKCHHCQGRGCIPAISTWPEIAADPRTPMWSIDWVIVGGESGPQARPMHPAWVRSLRDQCVSANVPFLFKQWGEWAPNCMHPGPPCRTIPRPTPGASGCMFRCGKKRAGRELDGRQWNEIPIER